MKTKSRIGEIASLFFKLGTIAFGGPAAHIAMMEDEIVEKRKWISRDHFLDLIGATNLIPGPNSTEMTMHCGYERGGVTGLFAAGMSFIFPAVVITGILAWFYTTYGQLPEVQPFLYGIKPAVIAIILSALYKLGKKAIKSQLLLVLGIICFAACVLGVNEIFALFGTGLLGLLIYLAMSSRNKSLLVNPLILINGYFLAAKVSSLKVLLTFLKIGAILYGSGYVLFAFLDAELVANGIMSRSELIDAVAVGQLTPGPVLSTATFIGWQLNGWQGAILATVGIFLPSFLFVMILNPLIPKIRKSPMLSAFLDAVNVAAVAVIAAVCIDMGRDSIVDWKTALIAVLSIFMVFYFKKLNSGLIVLGSAILGYLLSLV